MTVIVQFYYEPDGPEDDHPTGVSNQEYEDLCAWVSSLGGYDVEVSRVKEASSPNNLTRKKKRHS